MKYIFKTVSKLTVEKIIFIFITIALFLVFILPYVSDYGDQRLKELRKAEPFISNYRVDSENISIFLKTTFKSDKPFFINNDEINITTEVRFYPSLNNSNIEYLYISFDNTNKTHYNIINVGNKNRIKDNIVVTDTVNFLDPGKYGYFIILHDNSNKTNWEFFSQNETREQININSENEFERYKNEIYNRELQDILVILTVVMLIASMPGVINFLMQKETTAKAET